MSGWSETPIFPGKTLNGQGNVASGSATTTTLFTADSQYGGIITSLRCVNKSTVARTCRLELKNASTVTILSRFQTSTTAYTVLDLMSSTYLPVNDADPRLTLGPSDILQLVTEDTGATALDVTAIGGTFAYPN